MPEEQERGKALYAVFCPQRGLGIHVHRTHLQPARVLLGEFGHLRGPTIRHGLHRPVQKSTSTDRSDSITDLLEGLSSQGQ